MDMNALAARVKARRADADLVAQDGTHCATIEQRDYRNLRGELMKRDDWGNLPAPLYARLVMAAEAANQSVPTV